MSARRSRGCTAREAGDSDLRAAPEGLSWAPMRHEVLWGRTSEETRADLAQGRARGQRLVSLCSYGEAGDPRHATVWAADSEGPEQRFEADVAGDRVTAVLARCAREGFHPALVGMVGTAERPVIALVLERAEPGAPVSRLVLPRPFRDEEGTFFVARAAGVGPRAGGICAASRRWARRWMRAGRPLGGRRVGAAAGGADRVGCSPRRSGRGRGLVARSLGAAHARGGGAAGAGDPHRLQHGRALGAVALARSDPRAVADPGSVRARAAFRRRRDGRRGGPRGRGRLPARGRGSPRDRARRGRRARGHPVRGALRIARDRGRARPALRGRRPARRGAAVRGARRDGALRGGGAGAGSSPRSVGAPAHGGERRAPRAARGGARAAAGVRSGVHPRRGRVSGGAARGRDAPRERVEGAHRGGAPRGDRSPRSPGRRRRARGRPRAVRLRRGRGPPRLAAVTLRHLLTHDAGLRTFDDVRPDEPRNPLSGGGSARCSAARARRRDRGGSPAACARSATTRCSRGRPAAAIPGASTTATRGSSCSGRSSRPSRKAPATPTRRPSSARSCGRRASIPATAGASSAPAGRARARREAPAHPASPTWTRKRFAGDDLDEARFRSRPTPTTGPSSAAPRGGACR